MEYQISNEEAKAEKAREKAEKQKLNPSAAAQNAVMSSLQKNIAASILKAPKP